MVVANRIRQKVSGAALICSHATIQKKPAHALASLILQHTKLLRRVFAGGLDAFGARFHVFTFDERTLNVYVLAFDGRTVGVRTVVPF